MAEKPKATRFTPGICKMVEPDLSAALVEKAAFRPGDHAGEPRFGSEEFSILRE
ncbi:MAG: hypothetical protein HQL95_02135 [Magnetococcales bacterium]|nr:hypothetical protein [Magnetococcales bacterium]